MTKARANKPKMMVYSWGSGIKAARVLETIIRKPLELGLPKVPAFAK